MKALSSLKKPNLALIITIGAILIGALGIAAYAYFANKTQDLPAAPQGTIKQEQVPSDTQSQSTLPPKDGADSGQPNQPPVETPSTPPEKPTIERAGGNPTVKVVATFQNASNGHCELRVSQSGGQTVSHTAPITVSTSYYACSFSIARSALPAGSLTATVVHHIGTASTSSDAKGIE